MGGMARLPWPLGGGRMLIRLKFTCYVICSLSLVPLCFCRCGKAHAWAKCSGAAQRTKLGRLSL